MMTAQQLKNSILQRAIEGKLVEQRPEEGTAKELLKDIKLEKEKLIKKGKIKKSKPLPPINEDEIPFDIPESWEWVRLGEIFNLQAGKNVKAHEISDCPDEKHEYLCYGGNGIRGYVAQYNREGIYPLIGRQGALCGNIHLANGKFYATEHAVVTDTFSDTDVIWAKYFLIALNLNQYATATAQPGLAVNKIELVLIPLPPLFEQHRIVSKIKELMPLVDQYDKAYSQLTDLNEKFPQDMKKSILQYAIEGKLVEQRPEEGTAKELLKQIKQEKEKLVKEGKIKKSKPLPTITEDEIPFEIPENWEWVRLTDIFDIINGDRGKNYPSKSVLQEYGEIPFISAINIENGSISEEKLLYISEERYKMLRSGHLQYGDLVLCIRGSLGKNGRYPFQKGAIASSLVILRAYIDNEYLYDYFSQYLNTGLFAAEIKKYDNGTAQPNLGARDLAKFLVPIPPLSEQHRIVEQIKQLFTLCEKIMKE